MWPTDLDYGIFGFEFEGKPSGGKIKQKPEDFLVIEVDPMTDKPLPIPPRNFSPSQEQGGLFLMGRVWRRNMDHSKMVRELSQVFGVPEDNISTAGIKDANAEIVQLFSVFQPRREVSDPALLDIGLEVDSFQYVREKVYPGSMGGNYFEIIIRDTKQFSQEDLDQFISWVGQGMLNHYGYQRFGSGRPITPQFGRALANKRYKDAVDIYLGGRSRGHDEEYRKHWRENQDPDELLLLWKGLPHIERDMLQYLSKRPRAYEGAISKMPNFLRNIGKSAFISLLANNYLSRRGLTDTPLPGERHYGDNIEIALPSSRWKQPLNQIWTEVFDAMEIEMKREFKSIRHTSRMLRLTPKNFSGEVNDDHIKVSFQLENGQYATTVLRQLMQEEPSAYF